MNISLIASTIGYTTFRGTVTIYSEGGNSETLFTGPPHRTTDSVPSYFAEQSAYDDAAAWVRRTYPMFAKYLRATNP